LPSKNSRAFGIHKCYFGQLCGTLSCPQKTPALLTPAMLFWAAVRHTVLPSNVYSCARVTRGSEFFCNAATRGPLCLVAALTAVLFLLCLDPGGITAGTAEASNAARDDSSKVVSSESKSQCCCYCHLQRGHRRVASAASAAAAAGEGCKHTTAGGCGNVGDSVRMC